MILAASPATEATSSSLAMTLLTAVDTTSWLVTALLTVYLIIADVDILLAWSSMTITMMFAIAATFGRRQFPSVQNCEAEMLRSSMTIIPFITGTPIVVISSLGHKTISEFSTVKDGGLLIRSRSSISRSSNSLTRLVSYSHWESWSPFRDVDHRGPALDRGHGLTVVSRVGPI